MRVCEQYEEIRLDDLMAKIDGMRPAWCTQIVFENLFIYKRGFWFAPKIDFINLKFINCRFALNFEKSRIVNCEFVDCNMSCTKFCDSTIINSIFERCDLWNSRFRRAQIDTTNFVDCDLAHAEFTYAALYKTDFHGDGNNRYGMILDEPMIGYKKCKFDTIVKLEIPKGAVVFSINNGKCRTNRCRVLEITDSKWRKIDRAYSKYKYMSYYIGDEFNTKDFDLHYNIECATGIHFFRTAKEAVKY